MTVHAPYVAPLPYKDLGVPKEVVTVAQGLLWATRQLELSTQAYNAALPARLDRTAWQARHDGIAIMRGEAHRDAVYGFYGDYPPAWSASLDNVKDDIVKYPPELDQDDRGEMLSFMLRHGKKMEEGGYDDMNMPADFKAKLRTAKLACSEAMEVN